MDTGLLETRLLRRSIFASSTLVIALAISVIAAGQARAAFPGANGRIVFETNRDGNEEIYTMNADGTNRVDLTRNPADDTDPRWSADGSRIVGYLRTPVRFTALKEWYRHVRIQPPVHE